MVYSKLNSYAWVLIVTLEFVVAMLFSYNISHLLGAGGVALPGIADLDSHFYYKQISGNFLRAVDQNESETFFVPFMSMVSLLVGGVSILAYKFAAMGGLMLLLILVMKIVYMNGDRMGIESGMVSSKIMLRIALFPSAILMIATPLGRDIWIYVGFFLATYFSTKIVLGRAKIFDWVLVATSLYILFGFRDYAAASVVVGWILFYVIGNVSKRTIFVYLTAFIAVFAIWFIGFSSVKLPIVDLSLEDALLFQSGYILDNSGKIVMQETGGSDFMGPFDSSNIVVFIAQLFESFAGNLIGPFFWQAKSAQLIGVLLFESVPMVYLLFMIYRYRKEFFPFIKNNTGVRLLFGQAMAWWAMLALTNNNIGTGMRLKIPLFLFIWIIYYLFMENRKNLNINHMTN